MRKRRAAAQMTEAFHTVLAASERERHDLFLGAANRLGTAEQNIEKDFWVCWTLDALFNGLDRVARACSSKAAHRYRKVTV